MRPDSNALVNRDPALAALCGFTGQADFGADPYDQSLALRSDVRSAWDASRGQFGNADLLASDAAALSGPNERTLERLRLLDPNWGSTEKIGHYTFTLQTSLVLGASEGVTMTNSPLCDIKPERLIFNAPCYNFVFVSTVQIGNTSVIIGGSEDAFNYSNVAVDVKLSMPLLKTSSRALVGGEYTGITPAPFSAGSEYTFVATFHGPARMTT